MVRTPSRASGTFCVVPAADKPARRTPPAIAAALTAVASLLLTAPGAHAAPTPTTSPSLAPPPTMSTVGGDRLGRPGTQVEPAPGTPAPPEDVTARSWIVADAESGDVLAAHNAHWPLAPASTLKMLFADTLLPKFPATLEHRVTSSDLEGLGPGSSLVGVKEDETYTVRDLWLGVFLRSGNDAVRVLSSMNEGGAAGTVEDMNAHAEELRALDTHVVSPDGYDAPEQVSSAYDLTLFARSGLQKKDFREYCSTVRARFPGATERDDSGEETRGSFEIQNTNRLLSGDSDVDVYQGIAGVKNGNTSEAGATFTAVAERADRVLLVTVMHPESGENNGVYKEAARLLDWGFEAAGSVEPVGELVAPRGAEAPEAEAPAAPGDLGGAEGTDGPGSASGTAPPVVATAGGEGGLGTALAVAGGALVLLAGGAFLVNRRWPRPASARRRMPR